MPLKENGDFYGYRLALVSSEMSLVNLTNAYRTLADGGRVGEVKFAEPSLLPGVGATDSLSRLRERAGVKVSTPAINPRAASIVTDILADPMARARTFGTDSVLATRFWTAIKTGTSKDMRDSWAVGYSQRYTVGVWVGNASGAPMWDVSGTSSAAPIWAALMNHLHSIEPSRAPVPPPGLGKAMVDFGGAETARHEWFVAGTEKSQFAIYTGAASALFNSSKHLKHTKTEPPAAN